METVWWLLKQLYNKGLLYKGYTIQPYSPKAGTGLSSHELNQPGCYRDVSDTTITAQFKVKDFSPKAKVELGSAEVLCIYWLGRLPLGLCLPIPPWQWVKILTMSWCVPLTSIPLSLYK